ncbi:hypothetical protein TNCV_1312821 [Trichonephila clavipes]|nr:hypothetical protein TNCV_1312821 [Trichonephila clavipes]
MKSLSQNDTVKKEHAVYFKINSAYIQGNLQTGRQTFRVRRAYRNDLESRRNAGSQMPLLRAMVQRGREKEQKQQHIKGPENILLKVCKQQMFETTTRSRLAGLTAGIQEILYILEDSRYVMYSPDTYRYLTYRFQLKKRTSRTLKQTS